MKHMYRIVIAVLLGFSLIGQAQTISPYLIGNNAWYDASLANLWDDMALAKFQAIRVGGAGAEGYGTNYAKYITLIDGIRTANAEPIVQVPRTLTAQQAKDFITYINITMGKRIKYWIIGNEPNMTSYYSSPTAVGAYTRQIASALKSVDNTILTIGPETAWYDLAYMNSMLVPGGANDITGKDAAGNYYIDVVTWHKYGFTSISSIETDVNTFLAKIGACNDLRPEGKKISWGLTEFNTTFNNDQNTLGDDQNVWSFRAGQLYAELYGLGMRKGAFTMTAWSMLEGEIERRGTDLSLFDKDYSPRSNYYHSLMLGQNMKKKYLANSDNQSNITVIPMGDETGTAVMVLNNDRTTGYNYTLRLSNTSAVAQSNNLNIYVNAGMPKEVYGYIPSAATQMLVFDAQGNLTKRYIYTAHDALARRAPIVQTVFCNTPPAINLIPKQYIPKDKGMFTVNLSGITDADKCSQGVTVTAVSSNPAVVSVAALNYTSCNSSGTLDLLPNSAGLATITLTVTEMQHSCTPVSTVTSFVVNSYNPTLLPGKLEAENYIEMKNIQTQTTTDTGGGYNVGYIDQYDWMEYGVRVAKAGTYDIGFRLASKQTPAVAPAVQKYGGFELYTGTTKLTTVVVDTTGGWQVWKTQTAKVALPVGDQVLRIRITASGFNINWMDFVDPTASAVPQLNARSGKINICKSGSRVVFDLSNVLSENKESLFRIVNMAGQVVFASRLSDSSVSQVEIARGELPSGVFIAVCDTENGRSREKFILNE